MLRSFQKLSSCGSIRRNSVLAKLAGEIRAGKEVGSRDVEHLLTTQQPTTSDLEHLHDLLKLDVGNDAANVILSRGLPYDFSLYFTALKKVNPVKWNDSALESLIRHNPGRVFTSAELLTRHGSGSVSDAVRLVVVHKLLAGEITETRDEKFIPTDASISQAISLLNQMPDSSGCVDILNTLIETLESRGNFSALFSLKLKGFHSWLSLSKLQTQLPPVSFLALSQLVFSCDPEVLSTKTLCKVLSLWGLSDGSLSASLQNLGSVDDPVEVKEYLQSVLKYVERLSLDFDKKDPESLLMRMQLIETYGIDNDDIDTTLQKFHAYQSHDKFGIDLVQAKVVKAFCYQSFKTENETFLKIAETLIRQNDLAVSTVAHLILAKSRFSSQKSLDIYNEYINLVSKNVNETTKRSPTGVLTEALMIASLYDNDREFSQLLYEKAIQNGVISDEHEIALIKRVFKIYGECFVEDDWKVAQPAFAKYVLECIKAA